jgi:hypothetical protein
MADNTTLPIGTGGDLISTDELSTRDGAAATAGEKVQLSKPGFGAPNDFRSTSRQFPFPVDIDSRRLVSYWGRACSFKTPGRAAVSQKILSIHNAVGSAVLVAVNRVRVDILSTAVKAVTVVTPVIRVVRYTTVQTNGTVLAKGSVDTALTSNASVTITGDASADGTLSGTTLTLTPAGTIAQAYAPRVFTAVGYELMDTITFFEGSTDIILRAGQGIAVFLESAVVTTGIPATDSYISAIDWNEYTAPD